MTTSKTIAIIRELGVQANSDYYKEFKIGASVFKRYSPLALDFLKKKIPEVHIVAIWEKHKHFLTGGNRKKGGS